MDHPEKFEQDDLESQPNSVIKRDDFIESWKNSELRQRMNGTLMREQDVSFDSRIFLV